MRERNAFWIDHDYDRAQSSDTGGRYAAYVAANSDRFRPALEDIAPVRFACLAWELATQPRLDPGFVRWHSRILDASCHRGEWDGGLDAHVRLVSPRPGQLSASRAWEHDRGWRDWPQVFGQFVEPSSEKTAAHPYLRAVLLAQTPLPVAELPPLPAHDKDIPQHAERAVSVIVRELNDQLNPILRSLDEA
ncbi:hypothetical protein I6A60_12610 [Frankia sp. AgB1.9]|uniref:hypothetical protein n=1 Tax=unclassified Frankia TaxID=2632575 RepID=UPI001933BF35|nr:MULTISPECIES: hypothetical protein [unclassified Frankia]MBL7489352.1 hypothetical protein [Frankia sp. AgW1.1]MBL7548711.1 hypothetical protein [Frankia sp. AgB1.9]MBL7619309.1 hypothetical protein [Frankia sp. AgB1.8]